jgi:hypothetical protein
MTLRLFVRERKQDTFMQASKPVYILVLLVTYLADCLICIHTGLTFSSSIKTSTYGNTNKEEEPEGL